MKFPSRWILFSLSTLFVVPGVAFAQQPGEAVEAENARPGEGEMPPDALGAEGAVPNSPFAQVKWQVGPSSAELGNMALIQVPEGYRFANAADTKTLMTAMGNPVDGTELGFLAPDDLAWFVLFEFDDIGYVPDEDKDDLDADAILDSIKEGNEHANTQRRANGWGEVRILGWQRAPYYDETTKNLEWAIKGESEGLPVTNFNTRILGREGVMKANLVIDPEQLDAALPTFKQLLTGYGFKAGHTYAEYKKGDKIAEYGLVGLVAGGAAAVAVKSGFFAKLFAKGGKLIIVAIAAIGGLFAKLFGKKNA